MILALLALSFLCAVIPCVLFCVNLRRYAPPPEPTGELPAISILIPARNEAGGIAEAMTAALATRGISFELVIMDDGSTDGTAEIVLARAALDPRVRLEHAPPLPPGWNGKQHACWALANAARHPLLCFVDADVRLEPDCIARMATFLERGDNGLVSGFPQQLTGTPLEWLLLPLIHFVLLGFLPMGRMRRGTDPAFAAGCGQFFLARRDAYFACGGHSGIPLTMHDGLRLPRLFREHGYPTDLADITTLARCRMYTNARDTWQGLAKNATEGLGAPGRIVPITLILLLGQVLPFVTVAFMGFAFLIMLLYERFFGVGTFVSSWLLLLTSIAIILSSLIAAWLPRILSVRRFHQDWRSALLHPFGILLLLTVQWYALLRKLRGGQVSWRGRAYTRPSA